VLTKNSNWLLVVLITSDALTGRFFFDSNSQAESAANETDVQKRTAEYFKYLLYATAILSLIRYTPLLLDNLSNGLGSPVAWFISANLAS
jgi:hypothetical protein